MPAPAVIPAPIAYIKVVAVKKLVVDFQCNGCGICMMLIFAVLVVISGFQGRFEYGTSAVNKRLNKFGALPRVMPSRPSTRLWVVNWLRLVVNLWSIPGVN